MTCVAIWALISRTRQDKLRFRLHLVITKEINVLRSIRGYRRPMECSSSVKEPASPREEASTMLSVTEVARERIAPRPRPEKRH